MARKMKVCHPATAEIQQLSKKMNELVNPHQQRRAEALILYGMGLKPLEIAMAQSVHLNTIYKDLHAFEQLGVEERFGSCRKVGHPVELQPIRSRKLCSWLNNRHRQLDCPMDAGR